MAAKTAQDLHSAMVALRQGKMTPDEFRAVTRESREENGPELHDRLKFEATAAFSAR
jgi:hypothetical protein